VISYPYHAIVYIPVPCEESCPVKAISKDEHGVEHIDESCPRMDGAMMATNFSPFLMCCSTSKVCEISKIAHELLEKLEEGQKFMTTSCCPSYIELVEKHMTEMKPKEFTCSS